MQKPATYAIQGSNLELFGTEVEHNCRETAAQSEEQWHGTGKAVGLKIWRIEKFKVVPWPVEHYGEFYEGDSYIVFNTHGTPPHFQFDVHFWLGTETSQDEAGTAAYKTVELDDFHKGEPVEHREVQGYESELFCSYFPKGIRILKGGIESGFRHVTKEEYKPRLYHVRGGSFKDVRINEVPLTRDSLNSGDVFILDLGMTLYQWNGRNSAGMERMKAGQFCRSLDDERGGKPEVIVFDEPNGNDQFWQLLGGQGPIKSAEEGSRHLAGARKVLYRLSDASGSLQFTKVAEGTLNKSMLDSSDAFICDTGNHVFVWVGKNANTNERRNALGYATKYLGDNNLPLQTPITRVPEGGVNTVFESAFH